MNRLISSVKANAASFEIELSASLRPDVYPAPASKDLGLIEPTLNCGAKPWRKGIETMNSTKSTEICSTRSLP
jgi:hypothetical protein